MKNETSVQFIRQITLIVAIGPVEFSLFRIQNQDLIRFSKNTRDLTRVGIIVLERKKEEEFLDAIVTAFFILAFFSY